MYLITAMGRAAIMIVVVIIVIIEKNRNYCIEAKVDWLTESYIKIGLIIQEA